MAETVGSLIDKVCIAELKLFHMQKQVDRTDATAEHRHMCSERVVILTRQRDDLLSELATLQTEWAAGRWTPKVYRQFKMYNDPKFRIKTESIRAG